MHAAEAEATAMQVEQRTAQADAEADAAADAAAAEVVGWYLQTSAQAKEALRNAPQEAGEFLPSRKVKEAEKIGAKPKMQTKPTDTEEFPRDVSSRSHADRKRQRQDLGEDDRTRPWDARGPPGPQEGGPNFWRNQKYRTNTGRWANPGGKNREEFSVWHKKKAAGLTGDDLRWWHPYTAGGHWEREAWRLGIPTPREKRDAEF